MIKDPLPPHAPERNPQQRSGRYDPNRDPSEPSDEAVSFHREKFRWLDQLRADPELTPLAFLVAYVLADLVNPQRGYAWPSIAWLASECRVTERGVQKIIRRLVERGHLFVEFGQGRSETNHYRWIIKDPQSARGGKRQAGDTMRTQLPENETQESRSSGKGRTPVHPNPSQRVNHGSEKGEQPFQKGRTAVHPTQSNESIYDPFYRSSSENAARSPPEGSGPRTSARHAGQRDVDVPRQTKNLAAGRAGACWTKPPSRSPPFPTAGLRRSRLFDRSAVGQLHDEADFDEVLARIRQRRANRG